MTINDLFKLNLSFVEVNGVMLTQGIGLTTALVRLGITLPFPCALPYLKAQVMSLPTERRDAVLQWEIDPDQSLPTSSLKLPDSQVVSHVNSVTVWTLCLTTFMLVGAISWNIVLNHTYPRVALSVVAIGPVTLCALWVIGVLRERQSVASVVLGDGESQTSAVKTLLRVLFRRSRQR